MALPANAKVAAAPNFLTNLNAAHQFFLLQDATTAETRFSKLKTELREMIAILAWSPASGRPARFLATQAAQTRLKVAAVEQLAARAGLPVLREYVTGQYLVLYAHSDTEVVLLALKHQRELIYSAEV